MRREADGLGMLFQPISPSHLKPGLMLNQANPKRLFRLWLHQRYGKLFMLFPSELYPLTNGDFG